MNYELSNNNVSTCDECGSEYYSGTSQLSNLCPECSNVLYGYKNCVHQFEKGRCIKCFWNGNVSDYIQKLRAKKINKSRRILHILEFLQAKYGETNIIINDYWEGDKESIGLTDKTAQYLAFISTISGKENNYFLALENPPVNNEMPYCPAGEFNSISLDELENKLTIHFQLKD